MQPVVVLVHGAWHGSWAWSEIIGGIEDSGARVVVMDLPSCADPGGPDEPGDLRDDVRTVRSALDSVDGPVMLVGHSYGGIVISEAAASASNVERLVYVCAFMLEDGESLLGAVGGEPPDWFIYSEDGDYIAADRPEEIFYNDVPPEKVAGSVRRLKHFSTEATQQGQSGAAWREIPSTYVVCERDNAIPPAAQEAMSQRASRVLHMDASHSPFLSKPGEIAEILIGEVPAASS